MTEMRVIWAIARRWGTSAG